MKTCSKLWKTPKKWTGEPAITAEDTGKSLEEQLQDEIVWNHWIDQHLHSKDRYVSETRYQADEELPHGFQLTYRGGGPSYEVVDISLAIWHKEKAIELLDESYEELLRYFE